MAWDDRPGNLGSYGGGGGNGNWGSTGGNYGGGGGNYMGGGGSYNYRTVPGSNSIGNWNTGGQLVNFDGSRNQGPIRSNPIPPAKPNPANVRRPNITPAGFNPRPGLPIDNYFAGSWMPNIAAAYATGNMPWSKVFGSLGSGWMDRVGTNPKLSGPLGSGWDERVGYQPDRPGGKTGVPGNVGPDGRIY